LDKARTLPDTIAKAVKTAPYPHSGLGLASLIFDAAGALSYLILRWFVMDTGANSPYLLWMFCFGLIAVGAIAGFAGMIQRGRSLSLPLFGLLVNIGFWAGFFLLTPKL
jgi:hypothetical protein